VRVPDPASTGWVDGRLTELRHAAISIDDPAFHAGLGLYETFGVRDGRVLDLDEHLVRLAKAAERTGIVLPEASVLHEALVAVAERSASPCGWVKLVVTRGGRRAAFGGQVDPAEEGRPASAILLKWRRNPAGLLDGLKTLNCAENVLGLEEALRQGADEGLWLNTHGHLAEGCQSNLFVMHGRKLFTAGVRDGILPGIVRGFVLRAAREAGIAVHEGKLRLRRLETATEACLTSSVRGVRPLIEYRRRPVGSGRPGPVTRELAAAVARMRGLAESS